MPFGVATVATNILKAMFADRIRTTPGTYTNPPKYIGVGVGATAAARTAAATDTALSSEVETRANGTESVVTTSVTNDTYQVAGTITMTGNRALDEFGSFDASTVGNMGISGTQNVINLVTGDSITYTLQAQQT